MVDWEELIRSSNVDCVLICSPTHLHADQISSWDRDHDDMVDGEIDISYDMVDDEIKYIFTIYF